jgi:hypothetical protein
MLSVFSSPPFVPFCLEAFSGVLAIIGKKNNTTHPHLIQGFSFFLFLGELLLTPNKIWKNCSEEIRRNICILFILVNGSQPIIVFLLLGGAWGLSSQQQDLFNLMGAMYASVVFVGVNNSSSVQPVVAVERTVYYRERAAGMYSSFPYSFAQVKKKTVIIHSHLISSFISY